MSDSTGQATWARPRPGARGYRLDALLAAVVFVGMCLSATLYAAAGYYAAPAPVWVSALCIASATLPLALRRRMPEPVAIVVSAAFILSQLLAVPELLVSNIVCFIAIYSVGAWSTGRLRSIVVRGIIVVGMFTWLFIALIAQAPGAPAARPGSISPFVAIGLMQIASNLLFFGGAWYFGDRAWGAAKERAALESRTTELAREREVSASQAIALERVRIARELHDVVAHHVSVMGIQAGAARRVLSTDPAKATESLASIEASARSAVDELHRLLTTLRADEADEADDSPAVTGIEQVEQLTSEMQTAGVRVRYSVVGDIRTLPATTSVTGYRVVREALTNAVKHAGARASVDVRVRYLDSAVEVEVTDDGHAVGSASSTGAGLGLVGMRERVNAVGGELRAGPRARGGFLVRATLPAPTAAVPIGSATAAIPVESAASPTDAASPAGPAEARR